MSLTEKIKDLLANLEKEAYEQTDAIRQAEELSEKFSDIKPKSEVPSPEQYMGVPAFSGYSILSSSSFFVKK